MVNFKYIDTSEHNSAESNFDDLAKFIYLNSSSEALSNTETRYVNFLPDNYENTEKKSAFSSTLLF